MQLLIPWDEASLPLMLTVVRSRLRQVSWRLLAPFGITPQQYQVLRVLSDTPGLCHGELAGALGLDKPTTTRMIQTLQRKGWVDVLPHPCHGRKLRLELSPGGRTLVESLAPFRKQIREGLEAGMDEGQRQAVRALLHTLKTNLDRMEEGPVSDFS
jgi:DNA-binding MarR family transcriptional regulator